MSTGLPPGAPFHRTSLRTPLTVLLVLPVVIRAHTGDLIPAVVGMWSVTNSSLVFWDRKKNLVNHCLTLRDSFTRSLRLCSPSGLSLRLGICEMILDHVEITVFKFHLFSCVIEKKNNPTQSNPRFHRYYCLGPGLIQVLCKSVNHSVADA